MTVCCLVKRLKRSARFPYLELDGVVVSETAPGREYSTDEAGQADQKMRMISDEKICLHEHISFVYLH